MTDRADTQRADVWLWRARFAKTRGAAARLIAEGGIRLMRDGASRPLEKSAALIAAGDVLIIPAAHGLRTIRVEALPQRRGPPAEARLVYCDLEAQLTPSLDGIA